MDLSPGILWFTLAWCFFPKNSLAYGIITVIYKNDDHKTKLLEHFLENLNTVFMAILFINS